MSPGNAIQQIPWATLGPNDIALTLAADPVQGGLWLGFLQGGVAYFKDGQIRESYGAREGLGDGRVNHMRTDRDGTLWASTEGGLSRLKNGHVSTLSNKNGLPCDTVHWSLEDADGTFWLYMSCGLIRIARSELDA
jgi:ligand-binding sensor domain-containing protein